MNPHSGSSFDDLLTEEGIYKQVQSDALKRVLAEQSDDDTQSDELSTNVHEQRGLDTSSVSPARASPIEAFRRQGKGGATARLLADRNTSTVSK